VLSTCWRRGISAGSVGPPGTRRGDRGLLRVAPVARERLRARGRRRRGAARPRAELLEELHQEAHRLRAQERRRGRRGGASSTRGRSRGARAAATEQPAHQAPHRREEGGDERHQPAQEHRRAHRRSFAVAEGGRHRALWLPLHGQSHPEVDRGERCIVQTARAEGNRNRLGHRGAVALPREIAGDLQVAPPAGEALQRHLQLHPPHRLRRHRPHQRRLELRVAEDGEAVLPVRRPAAHGVRVPAAGPQPQAEAGAPPLHALEADHGERHGWLPLRAGRKLRRRPGGAPGCGNPAGARGSAARALLVHAGEVVERESSRS
jgi:hypothetical protein